MIVEIQPMRGEPKEAQAAGRLYGREFRFFIHSLEGQVIELFYDRSRMCTPLIEMMKGGWLVDPLCDGQIIRSGKVFEVIDNSVFEHLQEIVLKGPTVPRAHYRCVANLIARTTHIPCSLAPSLLQRIHLGEI